MKILCLSNGTLDENLGSGYVILNFAKELFKKGHKVTLLDPRDYGFWGKWRRGRQYGLAIGMAIHVIASICRQNFDIIEIYGGEGWLAIWLVKRLLKVGPPIVSHSNGIESHVYVCEEYWRKRGIDWHPRSWFQISQAWLFDIGFRNADALIVVSHFDRAFAQKRNYQPRERLICIENALPTTFLGRERPVQRQNKLLFCGNWIPIKNIVYLSEATAAFLRKNPSWSLVVVTSTFPEKVLSFFSSDVRKQVDVIGTTPREELIELYENCAILILPSFYESFGLVVAEAMACGCSVMMTKVGIGASLRHNREAYLLNSPAPEDIHKGLLELTANEDLRMRIAVGGYRRVQELRWEQSTREWIKFVSRITEQ